MAVTFIAEADVSVANALAIGPTTPSALPLGLQWQQGSHPVPTAASVTAGERALALVDGVGRDDCLVVLLSGGASALMAAPVTGLSLRDKQETTRRLLQGGADIHALNAVRKHLSRVKGGQLAARCAGWTMAWAISDVMDDDPSVIGSGPTVPDPTTVADALAVLDRVGSRASFPAAVVSILEAGAGETPKPGDVRLSRTITRVIGNRLAAVEGARMEAARRGYRVVARSAPVCGEARTAAVERVAEIASARSHATNGPCCFLSAGETTVTVRGQGRGGRNQEFALAAGIELATLGPTAVAASLGTDGIDGPTDAAGAVVATDTLERARCAGLESPETWLEDNNSYAFFAALGDLIVTGPTETNVGDVQIVLTE
jgi:hydroxypyruvate reductase